MASSYPEPGTTYSGPLTEALSKVAVERTIAIPFRFDTDGYVAVSEGQGNIIRQEILTLMLTYIGERVMMLSYGSNLAGLVFEPNDPRVLEVALLGVKDLILTNFPDVSIVRLGGVSSDDDGEMLIQLDYSYRTQPNTLTVNVNSIFQQES